MRNGRWPIAGRIARTVAACGLCLAGAAVARGQDAAAAQPAATGTTAAGPLPYWQAPALPSAVIQGGAIPAGWQPQAVPYQGIGPDGRPLTMYFAPTYVFTYQSGPPVLAVPPVTRRPPAAAPASGAYGWNYQSQGAPAVPVTLPPATVTRYQPAPYQFPPDARALTGTPIVPPATPLPAPPPATIPPPAGYAPAAVPQSPISTPPAQWVPSAATPPPGVAPPQGFAPPQGVSPPVVPAPASPPPR